MVAAIERAHVVQWTAASPLWGAAQRDPARMQRPALLEFASDNFMEEMMAILARAPQSLAAREAAPASHRDRPPGAPASWSGAPRRLKLYQPAHGHFYLVAANLVCRHIGLPDKVVHQGDKESVFFVMRRLDAQGREMAWVEDAQGKKNWQPLTAAQQDALAPGEQRLPMFPLNYSEGGRKRRLFAGLVPVSSRETFQAAAALSPIDSSADTRMTALDARVVNPLNDLKAQPVPPGAPQAVKNDIAAKQVEASLFILLDLADFFSKNLPALWTRLYTGSAPSAADPSFSLYQQLASSYAQAPVTWQAALRQAWDQWDRITGESAQPPALHLNLRSSTLNLTLLRQRIDALLKTPAAAPSGAAPLPEVPKLDQTGETSYVLRCVYERPQCGPLHPPVVSAPTQPFTLASFFDPDAPAREIRIQLPADTTLSGLRKFKKNVQFLISDKLRQQMGQASDLKKALDGELGSSASFNLGEICSFSIPIITLCAFIVLMIFIILLNIVFWWLPLLRFCLPLKLKAKG
jgi:hypothetical protein